MDRATDLFPGAASTTRVVDVLVPVALDHTYSYRVPRGMELTPGDVVAVPLGPREVLAVVWANNPNPDPRLHNRLKDVSEKLDVPPLKDELRVAGRLGLDLYAVGARHGAADVLAHGRASRPRAGPARRAPHRRAAEAVDAGAAAGDRGDVRWPAARQVGSHARGRRLAQRDRWAGRRRHVDGGSDAARAAAAHARSVLCAAGIFAAPAQRGRCDARTRGQRHLPCRAARWRHRLGQDRGLFRGGGRDHPPRQAVAAADAGDRAHRPIPRALLAPFRRASAGVAFGADAAHPSAQLGRDRGRRGAGRGRRALGAVSALRQSRPHHRR